MPNKVLVSIATVAVVATALLGALQLLPFGVVENPPVVQEPAWNNPTTADLARKACFDCHSNQVQVPWYGHIAPVSWLVADHITEARAELNFSEMHRTQEEAHEAGEEVAEGEMPPAYYTLLHPEARLTDAERRTLVKGLNATLGGEENHDD